jgi:hypothetical protein
VWANATDNQQVDKPVKPVPTISRFAKLKNTKPWYQHFNLVVSPEFSGNHSAGNHSIVEYDSLTNLTTRHSDERKSSVQAKLGGQIRSTSIYMRVGYEKNVISEMRNVSRKQNDGKNRVFRNDTYNYDINVNKREFTFFGQHQFTPLLHTGYELYWESHDLAGRQKEKIWKDCSEYLAYYGEDRCTDFKDDGDYDASTDSLLSSDSYSYVGKGRALGARIDLGARYDFNQTQLTMDYGYSRERYRGSYFGFKPFTKIGHHIDLAIYRPWQYGLSTELSFGQVHEDANYPKGDWRVGGNISQRVSFEVKKLVTEHAALSLNYTRINFSDYRQNYDFSVWFLRLDYLFSNDKAPRRRKRHNNLMRAP